MPWSCLQGRGCGRLAGRCGVGGRIQKVCGGGASSAREEAGPWPPAPQALPREPSRRCRGLSDISLPP